MVSGKFLLPVERAASYESVHETQATVINPMFRIDFLFTPEIICPRFVSCDATSNTDYEIN